MSQPRRKPRKAGKSHQPEAPNYKKPLLWILGIGLVLSIGVGIQFNREKPQPVLYAQEVEVFRTHGCRCVFPWARSLREQGFRVRVYERAQLRSVRSQLHTPPNFDACHVGVYLGYFIEGHVAAGALAQITRERAPAIGLATANTVNRIPYVNIEDDENSDVLLIGKDGRPRSWYTAAKSPPGQAKPVQPPPRSS